MAYKVLDGIVYDDDKNCVAVIADMPPDLREEVIRNIELGSEAAPALFKLMGEINSGSFKPRQIVREIEAIYNKYK